MTRPVLPSSQAPADIWADFAAGNDFYAGGAAQTTFAAWLTALGGTFSRASIATYIGGGVLRSAVANVPRFQAGQGIRLTGAATNIQLQSGFATGWMVQGGTLVPLNATGPDVVAGSATTFTVDTTNNPHKPFYAAGINLGAATYTFSAFLKANGWNFVQLDPFNLAAPVDIVVFNLTDGSIPIQGSNVTAAGTIGLANGWWLCWLTIPVPAAGNYNTVFTSQPAAPITLYTGDGVSGFLIYGPQITQTAFPCDYIPTTTTTVTQAADSLAWPYTQTTFSILAITNSIVSLGGNTNCVAGNNSGYYIYTPDATHFGTYTNVQLTGPLVASVSDLNKTMAAGSPTGASITSNGQTPTSQSTGAFAVGNAIFLGSAGNQMPFLYGNISQLALWNGIVASAADMEALTNLNPPPAGGATLPVLGAG